MAPGSLDATTLRDLVDGYKVPRALHAVTALGVSVPGLLESVGPTDSPTRVVEASR